MLDRLTLLLPLLLLPPLEWPPPPLAMAGDTIKERPRRDTRSVCFVKWSRRFDFCLTCRRRPFLAAGAGWMSESVRSTIESSLFSMLAFKLTERVIGSPAYPSKIGSRLGKVNAGFVRCSVGDTKAATTWAVKQHAKTKWTTLMVSLVNKNYELLLFFITQLYTIQSVNNMQPCWMIATC